MEPGARPSSGRAADVFDHGDDTVPQRYPIERHVADEARLMTGATRSMRAAAFRLQDRNITQLGRFRLQHMSGSWADRG